MQQVATTSSTKTMTAVGLGAAVIFAAAAAMVMLEDGDFFGAAAAGPYVVTKPADSNDGACDADCSLREAVIASNATADDDTIILPAGTYQLTIGGSGEDEGATGDLDVVHTHGDGSLTIIGAGMNTTIIDANRLDRVFDQIEGPYSAIPLTLKNLTIRNGEIFTEPGGGISSEGALTLDSVKVTRNVGGSGGGVYTSALDLIISNSIISSNVSKYRGGGLEIGDVMTATITNTTISGNRANGDDYNGGGGGVSVHFSNGPVVMNNVTIDNNSTASSGGGYYVSDTNDADVTTRMTNVTISNNSADNSGGGVFAYFPVYMTHSTIANNVSDANKDGIGHGGGLRIEGRTSLLKNSILAKNKDLNPTITAPDCSTNPTDGFLLSSDYNVVSAMMGCEMTVAAYDLLDTDPLLKLLGNYGGTTRTHAITPLSPAYNHVPTGECEDVDGTAVSTDQRGTSRPLVGACDTGSFEVLPAS